jgi:uncharacterized SAM-binding protein YcdF (DUF218 family)
LSTRVTWSRRAQGRPRALDLSSTSASVRRASGGPSSGRPSLDPKAVPTLADRVPCSELLGNHVELVDLRGVDEQVSGLLHQRRRDLAVEMGLTAFVTCTPLLASPGRTRSRFRTDLVMADRFADLPPQVQADAQTLWDYNRLDHEPRPSDVGIGLGSHDLGVATYAAELYLQSLFPVLAFTGANAPTTKAEFPRGEAIHYREHAIARGVPAEAILVETKATNSGENIRFTGELLAEHGIHPRSVLIICRPYQQRRAFATAKRCWPDVEVLCSGQRINLPDYIDRIGSAARVVEMIVGDTHRVIEHPQQGFAIAQRVPDEVHRAFQRVAAAGFTGRLRP